jgi:hypothetical protein
LIRVTLEEAGGAGRRSPMKGNRKWRLLVPLLPLFVLLSCMSMGEREAYFKAGPEPGDTPSLDEAPRAGVGKEGGEKEAEAPEAPAREESESGLAEAAPAGDSSAEMARSAASTTASAGKPQASGLKAGFADDNKQFNYFVQFLNSYGRRSGYIPIPIEERIVLRVRDSEGKSMPNAEVRVYGAKGELLTAGMTYADGSFLMFPAVYGEQRGYDVEIAYGQQRRSVVVDRFARREVPVAFGEPRSGLSRVPLDLLFILDTTGSMGEEIQRLKTTIELINLNLASVSSKPRVRFGMVLYKDRGDEYVTRVVPFTEDLQAFQSALQRVEASGGGDTPEDLQAALQQAMRMEWSRPGIRLGFIITDAPPHLDYGQSYTYPQAMREAKEKGIKIFGVGTGGLDLLGEVVLRQIAQYTSAKYIFMTYGETGESEGGAPGSVSHHTGANYQTDKLEAIIIRFAKEELSHVTDQPIKEAGEYFTADKVGGEQREETLDKLFSMAVSQLIDYSSVCIEAGTAAAVLPITPVRDSLSLDSEYFTEQLILSLGRSSKLREQFRLVERKGLQNVLQELELQLSDLAQEQGAAKVGRLLGAQLLITGTLYAKAKEYELFLKLVRVETGEVLSVTKALIDAALGVEA